MPRAVAGKKWLSIRLVNLCGFLQSWQDRGTVDPGLLFSGNQLLHPPELCRDRSYRFLSYYSYTLLSIIFNPAIIPLSQHDWHTPFPFFVLSKKVKSVEICFHAPTLCVMPHSFYLLLCFLSFSRLKTKSQMNQFGFVLTINQCLCQLQLYSQLDIHPNSIKLYLIFSNPTNSFLILLSSPTCMSFTPFHHF